MVWLPGGEFDMGSDADDSQADERPVHRVRVSGFFIDATEVTNAQFRAFVAATGYVTTAERKPDVAEIMKQVPPDTPPPRAEDLVPGALVFVRPHAADLARDWRAWWRWQPGADWKHPAGPGSDIAGRDAHPVVQVSWDDAVAFARWSAKRLPTEAEWEYAARGGLERKVYGWGDEKDVACKRANIWQGPFPVANSGADGYVTTAPVGSFAPNGFGLHDMAGNVWEWVADWYRPDTYARRGGAGVVNDPQGPAESHDPQEPGAPKRVTRGGSYLCSDVYCIGYRPSARMKTSPDTALCHTGFRCVTTPALLAESKAKR